MTQIKPAQSMRERILAAQSPGELGILEVQTLGPRYRFASNHTRNRWAKAIAKRSKELGK